VERFVHFTVKIASENRNCHFWSLALVLKGNGSEPIELRKRAMGCESVNFDQFSKSMKGENLLHSLQLQIFLWNITGFANFTEQSTSWEIISHSFSQESPTFYGNWRLITIFTKAHSIGIMPIMKNYCYLIFIYQDTFPVRYINFYFIHRCEHGQC